MADFPSHVRAAARLHTDMILRLPNVVGVGVGRRRVQGVATDEPVVVTYVTRKLPPEALRPGEQVPPQLDPDGGDPVRTDVLEVAEPRFVDVDTAKYRPVRGGCQIASVGGTGTAGAVMYDRRDQGLVLLTNNHVLTTDPTTLPATTTVWQPAGGPRVGDSKRIVPMFRAPLGDAPYRYSATVDAGIVAVDPDVAVQFDVVEVGRHPFVVLPPYEGLEVVRRGYRTQLKTGTVEQVDLTVIVKASNGDRHRIGGPDGVFSIRSPERLITAMPGDSGSLVVDAAGGAARGLVFASERTPSGGFVDGGLTFACELGTVIRVLELDTPCTGSLNALIRRAVFRRLVDNPSLSVELHRAGRAPSGLVAEMTANLARFRDHHLATELDGSFGAAIGAALQRLGPDLADAVTSDEDAAGLLDRAFGEWLIQPTVFDMLEYRFPDDVGAQASAAFHRVRKVCAGADDLEVLERAFQAAAGRSMRELLSHRDAASS